MQPSMFPQQLPMQHIFSAPSPFQMAPVQVAAVQQLLAAEKPQVVVKQTKQQQHAAIAAALRKPEPRKDVSAKKGVAERQYTIADLQAMLREVITGAASSVKAAASIAGFPHAYRTLARYTRAIRTNPKLQRDTDEDTLLARLDFVDQLEFKQKGNEDLVSRRLFSNDELDAFARQLKAYGDMGWALDYQLIRTQFSEAAATKGAIDWKTGEAFVVSTGYVSEFVRKRPELKAYKMSHIYPLRSKKANAQELAMCVVTRRRRGWDGMCRFCITLNTRVLHASKRSKTTLLPTYKCTVRTSGLRTLATIVSTMHHAPEAQEGHTPRPRCQHNRA